VNTVDLLLVLGGKIADVLTLLLSKRTSNEDKQQARDLVQQYNQVKEAHVQLRSIIRQYNEAIEKMLARRTPQELFPLCTYQAYQEAEQLYNSLMANQISYQRLDRLEVLSISLTTATVESLRFWSTDSVAQRNAQAYTWETWITIYQNRSRQEQEVVNCYYLIWSQGSWKIQGSEVFSLSRSQGEQ